MPFVNKPLKLALASASLLFFSACNSPVSTGLIEKKTDVTSEVLRLSVGRYVNIKGESFEIKENSKFVQKRIISLSEHSCNISLKGKIEKISHFELGARGDKNYEVTLRYLEVSSIKSKGQNKIPKLKKHKNKSKLTLFTCDSIQRELNKIKVKTIYFKSFSEKGIQLSRSKWRLTKDLKLRDYFKGFIDNSYVLEGHSFVFSDFLAGLEEVSFKLFTDRLPPHTGVVTLRNDENGSRLSIDVGTEQCPEEYIVGLNGILLVSNERSSLPRLSFEVMNFLKKTPYRAQTHSLKSKAEICTYNQHEIIDFLMLSKDKERAFNNIYLSLESGYIFSLSNESGSSFKVIMDSNKDLKSFPRIIN